MAIRGEDPGVDDPAASPLRAALSATTHEPADVAVMEWADRGRGEPATIRNPSRDPTPGRENLAQDPRLIWPMVA